VLLVARESFDFSPAESVFSHSPCGLLRALKEELLIPAESSSKDATKYVLVVGQCWITVITPVIA